MPLPQPLRYWNYRPSQVLCLIVSFPSPWLPSWQIKPPPAEGKKRLNSPQGSRPFSSETTESCLFLLSCAFMHQMQVPNYLGTSLYCTVKGHRHRGSSARSLGHSTHSVIVAADFSFAWFLRLALSWDSLCNPGCTQAYSGPPALAITATIIHQSILLILSKKNNNKKNTTHTKRANTLRVLAANLQ